MIRRLIFLWLIPLFALPGISQNIALNRNYELSVKPNYPYSAPATDTRSLTDGIYTAYGTSSSQLRFWSQPTTVGWQLENVSITIDLNKMQAIESVRFSTVRASEAGVYYPRNIFVFFSNDKINWKYIGNAADIADNLPGLSQRKKFSINNINQLARFVKVSVIRQGNFLFCDEIEVIKGRKLSYKTLPLIKQEFLGKKIDSLQRPENNRRDLLRVSNSLASLNAGESLKSDFENQSGPFNFQNFKNEIGQQYASYLQTKFKTPYILERYNPWAIVDEFRIPLEAAKQLNYNFLVPVGDVRYGSFLLTNLNSKKEKFYFNISGDSKYHIELYTVPFVTTSFYNKIPDPLIKVKDSMAIDIGQSQMFIFKILTIAAGKENGSITISSSKRVTNVNFNISVVTKLANYSIESLNANVWAYFVNPMINSHKEEAIEDLKQHYVNTIVVPPAIVPGLKDNNFTTFINYLKNLRGFKNIFLYMDYSLQVRKKGSSNDEYMSEQWKTDFKHWYGKMLDIILNNVGKETMIYLYPYDEVKDADISDFKKLILWAKGTFPKIRFYATLGSERSISEILPLLDIAQVHNSQTKKINVPVQQAEIWTYGGSTPSRELSPYSYYRLMSWDAFLNDFKGIGFWSYADERNGNNLNLISDKFLNTAGSYSVIYNDAGGNIISSRRWEAFHLGIEDYSILQSYAHKYGRKSAKELARQVLNAPENLNLADSIRDNMLRQILGIY